MEKPFLYHALATGLSGHITLPFDELIQVQAPSAIPFTGGYSASRAESFQFKEILSFRSVRSIVIGVETDDSWNTLTTAIMEGLNVLNMFTADVIVARIASKYPKAKGDLVVTTVGSHFDNLRIAGCPVEVQIDHGCLKPPSLATAPSTPPVPTALPGQGAPAISTKPPVTTVFGSLAKIDLKSCTGLKPVDDGSVYVPEFGTIHLAEFVTTKCYQSLTMFRIELGCGVRGRLGGCHASSNGEPMPG